MYRKDNKLILSGGIVDREFGHWMKVLQPNSQMMTPKAIITVCQGNVDQVSQRITRHIQNELDIHPYEKDMPIVFNEFCSTWGNPSEEYIKSIIKKISDIGVGYFVIDCGWYKKTTMHNDSWNIQHGDWILNEELFPHGIKQLVSTIHRHGMKAGIWFELESCGRESNLFYQEELLYNRDGYPITSGNGRFLDMLNPKVIQYLDSKVIKFLKDNDLDYLKVDYNANLGIGADGLESLGETLYQGIQKSIEYFRKLKKKFLN